MSVSVSFNNVYIQSCSSIGGPKEGKGPYGNYFDLIIDDHYNHQNTFEEGEVAMSSFSIKLALKKTTYVVLSKWWAIRDSNPKPSPCKGDALPIELIARSNNFIKTHKK